MDLRAVFITNLKKYRKEHGISQMKLAELCGTSTSYIGEIEIARKFPSPNMIQKIADALEIRPFMLFMDESDIYEKQTNPEQTERIINKIQQSVKKIITEEFV